MYNAFWQRWSYLTKPRIEKKKKKKPTFFLSRWSNSWQSANFYLNRELVLKTVKRSLHREDKKLGFFFLFKRVLVFKKQKILFVSLFLTMWMCLFVCWELNDNFPKSFRKKKRNKDCGLDKPKLVFFLPPA